MDTPLSVPAVPTPFPSVWRAIFSLGIVRRFLRIPNQERPLTSRTRGPAALGLGTFDWDEPDTSLTQAELEVLK
jgi:hypothetical protein